MPVLRGITLTSQGMGIHNEPGTSKLPLGTASDLVGNMLGRIVDTTDADRGFVPFKHDGKDEVVLLVNDLGAVSELEMSGITNEGELDLCSTLPPVASLPIALSFIP